MRFSISLYSSCNFSCWMLVSWAKRMSTIALACTSSSPKRDFKASIASCGFFEARIKRTTSSMLSEAIIKPSSMWARSWALRKSYCVRRITTSWRCSIKYLMQSFSVSSCGRPALWAWSWTNAMQFTANAVCKAVILNSLLSTTLALKSRFTSITMRIPSLSLSSFTFDMPSIRLSAANCPINFTSSSLLSP